MYCFYLIIIYFYVIFQYYPFVESVLFCLIILFWINIDRMKGELIKGVLDVVFYWDFMYRLFWYKENRNFGTGV